MAEFQINTNSDLAAERRAERRQRQRLSWIVGSALAIVAGLVVLIVITSLTGDDPGPATPPVVDADHSESTETTKSTRAELTGPPPPPRIADDGKTMWASPTSGRPISLAWLPTGCQLIVHARPASLAEAGELDKVVAALGPKAAVAADWLVNQSGIELDQFDSVLVGLRPADNFVPEWTIVLRPTDSRADQTVASVFESASDQGTTRGDIAYYRAGDGHMVVCSAKVLPDILELAGNSPALRRELDGVLAATDADRQLTMLVAPSFLFGEGREILAGPRESLRDRLIPLLPDQIKAVCISMHWSDSFFMELMVAPTGGTKPRDVAEQLDTEIGRWPIDAEDAVLGLTASDYGRRVVARLPAMLRLLARYTRGEFTRNYAFMRCYLPKSAGHSLLMGGELMTAYRSAGPGAVVAAPTASAAPRSVADKLAVSTSLTFNRDTLEMAIKLLSDDTGIPITINGGDLQIDGITKNQSFGINLTDRPAGEILVEILRLANPDKTATSANDPKQKLVFIEKPDGSLEVTTRAAAAKRGDELPKEFVP